jgi:Domain of unknown function (DUF1839)
MSAVTSGAVSLFGLDPATYRPHALHGGERSYPETNCYADVIIELLHARGDEPLAVMGTTVRLDFEGDQFSFFKPDPADLEGLFGIDIHEMQPYRPVPVEVAELLAIGRTMTVELDAWYLPDTAATSYRTEHVKTTVIPEAIDLADGRMDYFHNGSLYALDGDDYRGIFRLDSADPATLPPYTELVRFDSGPRLTGADLRDAARQRLRSHLDRVHPGNPFERFATRLGDDLPALLAGDEAGYHAYAFATVRMAGAGFEVCASHVDWALGEAGAPASAAMAEIVDGSKLLGFKLARRRPFDPSEALSGLAAAWDRAMSALDEVVR